MANTLLGSDVWSRITQLAAKKRAYVAAAYCGAGARKLLPIPRGSVLVVDMSLHAVKCGQTNPTEIRRFIKAGVEVHSVENLHAKVFVVGGRAIVGSSNVSQHSASGLVEAAIETTDPKVVDACRGFVESLCGEAVEVEHAEEMAKEYRPPKFGAGRHARDRSGRKRTVPVHRPLWAVPLQVNVWDETDFEQEKAGLPDAWRRIDKKLEKLDDFVWAGAAFATRIKKKDLVLQVTRDDGKVLISPAAHVVELRRYYPRGKKTGRRVMAFLAIRRDVRRKSRKRVMALLGRHAAFLKDLRSPKLIRKRATAHAVLNLWAPASRPRS